MDYDTVEFCPHCNKNSVINRSGSGKKGSCLTCGRKLRGDN